MSRRVRRRSSGSLESSDPSCLGKRLWIVGRGLDCTEWKCLGLHGLVRHDRSILEICFLGNVLVRRAIASALVGGQVGVVMLRHLMVGSCLRGGVMARRVCSWS